MSNEIQYTYWRGDYRHIAYEILTWEGRWAGYIYISDQQMKFDLSSRSHTMPSGGSFVGYDVWENPILQAVDDVVHGGVTLTEIMQSDPNNPTPRQKLKVGWDYSHYNSGSTNKERVYADCRAAIDALWEFNPDIKVFCQTVGGYHSLQDGEIRDGKFISTEGIQKRIEWGWDHVKDGGS